MADKVELQVELKSNLDRVVEATKGMKLDKGQEERLAKYSKGAQLALDSGDLKTFQKNFNNVMKLFKEAASVTGKVSDEIKKLTERQSALNQEINRLKDKKTDLEGKLTKDRSRLTADAAKSFAKTNADAKKIKTSEGRIATRAEIIELQKALNKFLKDTGRTISQVTNDDLKGIKTASGVTLDGRTSMFAMNRYSKAEQEYTSDVKADLISTETEITTQEEEYAELTAELDRMSNAANAGAESISKLYAEISKLGNETNKKVTDEVNSQKINKTDRTGATDLGTVSTDNNKQSSALKGAFKQFTLYTFAINALKTAGREAVQTIKELDKYLTEQAMVTGMTREQTYGLVRSYQDLALQCGATTKEIAQVATEYMKQGKTIQDSLVLTQAAVSAAKVARVSVGDSVNYLTTALNGFQLSAEDAMKVSDKFAAVAASSATDYDELAIALSKVASQANLAGMSIDYTTALLTKGLETTREAPETMGTALKTIIARMRELGDYGETLDDGMDINNVESQLSYVGIALRDTNGELRSTEDVLDELGKKWDTLDKNQQAAIAKALAGTRQQSRLIAMMEDYERVTELQEISQRSAGATAAQAGTYLEGIEAAMNKIQVAWEKIVMTISDSEFIIGIFEWIGDSLNAIGDFLSTDFGIFTTITVVAMWAAKIVASKVEELAQQKLINMETLKAKQIELEKQKAAKENLKTSIQERRNQANELKQQKEEVALEKKENALKIIGNKLDSKQITEAEAKIATAEAEAAFTNEMNQIKIEHQETMNQLTAEENLVNREIDAIESSISANMLEQTETGSSLLSIFGNFIPVLSTITTLLTAWSTIQSIINLKKKAAAKLTDEQTKKEAKNAGVAAGGMFASVVKAFSSGGIPGVIVGLAIAAAAVAGVLALVGLAGMAISVAVKNVQEDKSAEKTAEDVNKLSAEIYKLTEKANAIAQITDSFDALDNKLIKTNADLKEMNELLDQAADKLSDEIEEDEDIGYGVGVSELDYYNSFSTTRGKRQALDDIEKNNRNKANAKRTEQINKIKNLSGHELRNFLNENTTSAEIRMAQDAIYALNNNELYEYLDAQKDGNELTESQASAIESLTQSILEEMSVEEAWAYAKDDNGTKVQALVQQIQGLVVEVKNLDGELEKLNVAEVLMSDDYSLKEQVNAYKETLASLERLGDDAATNAFKDTFAQYDYFADLDSNILDFIDHVGLSIDELNELNGAWEKLRKKGVNITQEQWEERFESYLTALTYTNGDVLAATEAVFGQFLDGTEETLNAFIAAYGDIIGVGVLNMGQQMEKIQNKINNFYEKALEWSTMSESDRAEFLQDNADLFAGDEDLLKAFETGDYNKIEDALASSKTFKDQIAKQKEQIRQELLIEEAKAGDEKNAAYIAELKRYQEYLNDTENLFKASLEIRLEQEQKQLDEYRSYLEDQQSALEDSLNKRKEAYEKYFDDINKEEEAEDYEEQAEQLVSNLGKLGSSTNASAVQQTKELENQLKELEEERLKELREQAQEQLLADMDDQLEQINEKFDQLLESNQALLAAMQGDLENPLEYVTELLANKIEKGATALEVEDYIGTLQNTYGSVLGNDVDWDAIQVREENNQLFLNVNGTEVVLDTGNEQNLYQAIMKALREVGVR